MCRQFFCKEWNQVNRQKLSLYLEKKEPDLPLEANKEFQSIKNKIIQAVLELPLPEAFDLEQDISKATEPELAAPVQAAKMNEHFYPHYLQCRQERTERKVRKQSRKRKSRNRKAFP